MIEAPVELRPFSVHAHQLDRNFGRVIEESSFEEAAIVFVEAFFPTEEGEEIIVIVRDLEDGHERRFRLHVHEGEAVAQ